MSRTLPSTVQTAIAGSVTQPAWLLHLGFSQENRLAAWDSDISWDGQTWQASGAQVKSVTETAAAITLPASDTWLGVVLNDGTRGRAVNLYIHYTDLASSPIGSADAVLVFSGIMDDVSIGEDITIRCVENRTRKTFPPDSIQPSDFNYLPASGSSIIWGPDVVKVR